MIWGAFLVVAGFATNQWVLSCWSEVQSSPSWLQVVSWTLLGIGATTILLRRRPIVQKLSVAMFAACVVSPPVAELALRISLKVESSPTRNANLYADYYSEDDYWILHLRWFPPWVPSPARVHPELGWSQANVTAENPLGLYQKTIDRMRDPRPQVAFYGDSYVAGSAPEPDHIPAWIEQQLEDTVVLDLGVHGYGTDQIGMMFQRTHASLHHPLVVIGVMLWDIDRAILSVRTGKKPRLVFGERGNVTVTGVPIERDQHEFFASGPLSFSSYVLALVRTRVRKLVGQEPKCGEKKALNRSILEAEVGLARANDLDLVYVIFYPPAALRGTDWREEWLKDELNRLGVPFVDTKPLLLEHCKKTGATVDTLYVQADGHHNAAANHVIGDGVAAYLRGRGVR
ncbi:MAG: hypothetical protein H6838_07395 [Planctomycetes bacterium]|nr:hypothetical protein [Planctomycetota bacterium]